MVDKALTGAKHGDAGAVVNLKRQTFNGAVMLYDAARIQTPDPMLFNPTGHQPVSSGGRNAAWYTEGDFGQAVLRHYRRGGLVAKLVRRSYVWTGEDNTRAFAELRLLDWMHAQGMTVPRPLAAVYWRCGLLYQAAILIERVQGVHTLAECLEQDAGSTPEQVAQAIYAMHEVGVWHADLNAHNVLLDGTKAWLIDFDRGRRSHAPLVTKLRVANLQRLRRSMNKLAQQRGEAFWQRIHTAYYTYGAEN